MDTYRYPPVYGPWQTQRFVIIATCLLSKFKDTQVAIATDADNAKKQWIKNNDRLGIDVHARYGEKVEVMDEAQFLTWKSQLVTVPNTRHSVRTSVGNRGNGTDDTHFVKFTQLTPSERADVLDWLADPESKVDFEFAGEPPF